MMKTALTALLGLGLVAGAAAQEADLADDARMVRGVVLADLEALVVSQGDTVTSTDKDGVTASAETEDGLKYSLDGTACDTDLHCLGVNMVVSYTFDDGMTDEDLNRADVKYAATSVWRHESNFGVSRYIILDGGMTMENLKANMVTLLSIAPKVSTMMSESVPGTVATSSIDFGDDAGSDANDGVCDDARFHPDGDNYTYTRKHVMHDATDCRAALASGLKSLTLDFGDDSGTYANDGECDDSRFTGEGRSALTSDSHIKKDASDCIAAYQIGELDR